MPRLHYIDTVDGSDSGQGYVEQDPRRSLVGIQSGDWVRLARGSDCDFLAQIHSSLAQGVVWSDYGNPLAPRPKLRATMPTGTNAFNFGGDALFHNIDICDVQRSTSETTDSNTGPNACSFGVRGGLAQGAAEGVSGVFINVGFRGIGNNALRFGAVNADGSQCHLASEVIVAIGCDADELGGDFIYGAARDYMEVGWCQVRRMGNRVEPLISANVPGRRAAADAVGMLGGVPLFSWIHDSVFDHSAWDCKQIIMFDAPASQSGHVALVERVTMTGYGASDLMNLKQALNNAGVNSNMKLIMRQCHMRGSRLLVNLLPGAADSEVYANAFDVTGQGTEGASLAVHANNVKLRHNQIRGVRRIDGPAVMRASGVTGFRADANYLEGFAQGFRMNGARGDASWNHNAFFDVAMPYGGVSALPGGADDIILNEGLVTASGASMKPSPRDYARTFREVEQRVPGFWARFNPAGIAYIGASTGAF